MALLVAALVALLIAAGLALAPAWTRRRRARIAARPFPAAWRAVLRRNVPAYARLPDPLKRRLRSLVNVFLAEKDFIGCAGQTIDDEVRVTIAAHACLLLLGRRSNAVFPGTATILVYPGAFAVERLRPEPSGVLQETRQVLAGESWSRGQVVLSWDNLLADTRDSAEGRNVVIHEFAHQLDQEKGYANGAPMLGRRARYETWSRVLGEEFARLRARLAMGEATLLSSYGATDPAEFFAVATEVFFGRPDRLTAEHPELYQELSAYYRIDPAGW